MAAADVPNKFSRENNDYRAQWEKQFLGEVKALRDPGEVFGAAWSSLGRRWVSLGGFFGRS